MKNHHHPNKIGLFFLLLLNITVNNAQQIVNASSNSSFDAFLDYDYFDKDYSHVGSLKFHLIEEKIPKLISEVCMNNMRCPLNNCAVSLIDVVEATQLSRFNTTTLVTAIGQLNINYDDAYNICLIYDLTPQSFEYLLNTFGFTFSGLYKNFVDSLVNPSQRIPEILNTLNVSITDFMNAQAYGNDSTRLQVLSHGNYSKENMLAVLKIANKTGSDMLNLIPLDLAVRQIRKLNPVEFTNFVKNLGVTSNKLEVFYKYLGITPINFLTYPVLIQVITGFYDILNPQEVLATLISLNQLVTSNKAKALATFGNHNDILVTEYSRLKFELVENPLVQYSIDSIISNNSVFERQDIAFINIKNSVTTIFAEIANNYNFTTLKNCTYVSKCPYGGLCIQNVSSIYLEKEKVVMTKTNNDTVYNLGSPLFCNDTLYGFAVEDNANYIKFSSFIKKMPSTIPPKPTFPSVTGNGSTVVTHPTATSKPSKASTLFVFNVINIVMGFVIIKILL